MISVHGIGWIDGWNYGSVRRKTRMSFKENNQAALKEVFLYPFKNFGRLDDASKVTCCAVSLALKDAGLDYPLKHSENAGIVGTSATGCLDADIHYFRDYVESGRTLARGNLFVYTLPSSPLGEAAIHFGFNGLTLYIGGTENLLEEAVSVAASVIHSKDASVMLAGEVSGSSALYITLADESFKNESLCSMDQAMTGLRKNLSIKEMVSEFETMNIETEESRVS